MTNIEELNRRIATLETEVNSLKVQMGIVGTSQAAIAQIYSRLDNFAEVTNNNFEQVTRRFDRVENRLQGIEQTQASQSAQLSEILRILRDRNGGSGV